MSSGVNEATERHDESSQNEKEVAPFDEKETIPSDQREVLHDGEKGAHRSGSVDIFQTEVLNSAELMNDAFDGENREHSETLWQAAKAHPKACFWAFLMCFTIVSISQTCGVEHSCSNLKLPANEIAANANQVMESFDMFLNGNFVALPAFQQKYGEYVEGSGWTIPTRWQSALFQSGQCGAFVSTSNCCRCTSAPV